MNLTLFNHKTCTPLLEMLKRWLLILVTCVVCFNCLFCIRLTCDQTYEARNGHLCYPCSPGYFKVSDCVVNYEQARCMRCGNGKYQPYCDNSKKCASCRPFCPPGQVIVKHCNATSNKECQCEAGSFWKHDAPKPDETKPGAVNPDEGHCKPHSKCRPGEGMFETGTAYEDTKCKPCREGFSYSDNSSFGNCKPCSICNTTVIASCTATHDAVCGEQFPQRPLTTKNLSTGPDAGIISAIVISVAAVLVAVVVLTLLFCRRKRKKNSDPFKVDLSHSSEERGHGSGYNDTPGNLNGAVETPKDRSLFNNSISQKNKNENNYENESTNSFLNSQGSRSHEDSQPRNENDTNPDRLASSEVDQNEPKNEYVYPKQTIEKCTKINIPGPKDKNPIPDCKVSELQEDSTVKVSGTESQQQEDPRSKIQFEDENEDLTVPHDKKWESEGTRRQSSPLGDATTMQTDLETPVERKVVPANEMVENESLSNSCGENAPISTDAAAVSPRSSFRSGGVNLQLRNPVSPLDDVSKAQRIEENESKVRNYTGEDSEEDRSDDTCQEEIIWREVIFLVCRIVPWDQFKMFLRRLTADTNSALFQSVEADMTNVFLEVHNKSQEAMYQLMIRWRQATPKVVTNDFIQALERCQQKRIAEKLKSLIENIQVPDKRDEIQISDNGQNVVEAPPRGELSTSDTLQSLNIDTNANAANDHGANNIRMMELKL
ncbi:uncharacterized protein LOC123555880 [Mercenaria mercenaria]|uniref:uncharacterized protein LOC123555880 n=1 Tax=Mercenaria mercenaria TaxID=6596 RepID=UPI00234F1B26|nr:uncharacterized protein LOC123555880 [Mercenaria mercenaria]XP_053404266.1 uncharacterized protein LOC123555880 [Mercenaria mercenaria]XP_053404267.1 uncharacterized protein LOC123555880 [Mercenaria mercenaria]XP_053404268.1 uncharacterized protein LOC123555880 [Mercenaria mercenaria]XP_053404269.1 uncharacterized protein LOC123555880 [Mercenaria mercenaria]